MRHKVFGTGILTPLDRNAKAKLAHLARALTNPCVKGQAWGAITPKHLAIFLALLYGFHNGASGRCFPSYVKIAEAAHCAESTVALGLRALEQAKLLTWQQRLIRTRIPQLDVLGQYRLVPHVVRTSNAYAFAAAPSTSTIPKASNPEHQRKTTNQIPTIQPRELDLQPPVDLASSLARLKSAMERDREKKLPRKEDSATIA